MYFRKKKKLVKDSPFQIKSIKIIDLKSPDNEGKTCTATIS